jgi:hypothetical protein
MKLVAIDTARPAQASLALVSPAGGREELVRRTAQMDAVAVPRS